MPIVIDPVIESRDAILRVAKLVIQVLDKEEDRRTDRTLERWSAYDDLEAYHPELVTELDRLKDALWQFQLAGGRIE